MEITGDLSVSLEEQSLIDMHSVLNILNVVIYELANLEGIFGEDRSLDRLHDRVLAIAEKLRDPVEAHRQVANVDAFIRDTESELSAAIADRGKKSDPAVIASLGNIRSIFDILEVRAAEISARHTDPLAWVEHEILKLRNNFLNVLQAIERNSKGGYRIVYNLAQHEQGNYMVTLDITSANGTTVLMPAVFQDVMRDLLANARKYTAPGGTITAGLFNSGDELRYVVSDTGVGIPTREIPKIIGFGARGSNVADHPTRGGGFGVTKAYYVTRLFGGRMWIDSPVIGDIGTRVEIVLPVPTTVSLP